MNQIKNDIKFVQQLFSNLEKVDGKMVEPFSNKTQKFIDKLSNSTTEIIKDFLTNKATEIPLRNKQVKLYHYDNLLLTITDGKSAYNLEQNLQNLLEKNVVPKFIQYYELGNGEFLSVLEGDSEALLPYSSIAGSLSNQDKQLFKTILKQIINTTGQVNKEIFANKEPLFVGKNSKNIIYGDWSSFSYIEPNMKAYYISQIEKYSI